MLQHKEMLDIMIFMREEGLLTNEKIEYFTDQMTERYVSAAGKRAGNIMLSLGERIKLVNSFCVECTEIITRMMGVVCRFLPVVVFLVW